MVNVMAVIPVSWSELKAAIDANPQQNVALSCGAASTSIATMPEEATLEWLPGWTLDLAMIPDAISLTLWVREPLYRTATNSVRKAMEMEEASVLLHMIDDAWKSHKGRGWVRKHLEEDLRTRAAGGEPAADWDTVRTVRRAAYLVDYIAIMRSMRFGLWWPDQKAVSVIPLSMADSNKSKDSVQIDCTSGHILLGPESEFLVQNAKWKSLVQSSLCKWIPPACAPSIGTNTVAQIRDKLSSEMTGMSGTRQNLWNALLMEMLFTHMGC